jgi:N-acetylglucosaminyl-diphospho-decaprenol L-rhamnosyltransferase
VVRDSSGGPLVLTVILNYRTAELTLEAAGHALREMSDIQGEIVIVDNDSGDGSFEKLTEGVEAAGWDRVRVLQSGRNGGYGSGNNFGIRAGLSDGTQPDYFYLLNSDAFPDKGAIRILIDALEADPKAGFAGSYLHGSDGDPHRSAFREPSIWGELEAAARTGPLTRLLNKHVIAVPIPEEKCEVDWVAGASILMRRKALDEVGLFDERFFLYFEETDLLRRARKAGWTTLYVPESSVTHIGSVSTGMKKWQRTPQYWFDARLHYFVKNHGALYAGAATAATLAGGLIWRSRLLVQRKPQADPPHFLRDLMNHSLRALARGVLNRRAEPSSRPSKQPRPRSAA